MQPGKSPPNSENPEQRPPERRRPEISAPPPARGLLFFALILAMLMAMGHLFMKRQESSEEIPYYPTFVELVKAHKIPKCEIVKDVSGTEYVRGAYQDDARPPQGHKFKVYLTEADAALRDFLIQNNVEFRVPAQNPLLWSILSSILPVVLIFGLLYFFFVRQIRAAGHGALSFGKSRARLLNRDTNKVTFDNVAGIDEAKEEVQEIIEFLRDPKRFQKLGGRIPKGVLLMGRPGTGKTLLAKAIAGEANVPFFSISGSDFVEMFVGVGASRVRDMFEQGKKNAPCIIFIDEIDAVGRSRFTGIGGGHDEREQTLNALLVQMDGFETQEGVIIMAATNRPDVLDPALLRPGRFDRRIVIDLPTIDGREAILKMHARKLMLAQDVSLRRVARGTPGFSGADLENLLNEAALLGARQGKACVDMSDMEEARDKVLWGRERRSRMLDTKEKRTTAVHEVGHALVQVLCEDAEPLHKVTIIPRGMALGSTMSLPERDLLNKTRRQLLADLDVLMGGRAAEEIELGDRSTGAYSDLRTATETARHMVCDWGMSESLGPHTFGENQELLFLGKEVQRTQNYSEDTARKIDLEVGRLLSESYERAKQLILKHRDTVQLIANLLIERETLDGRDVKEIVEFGRILSEKEREEADRKQQADSLQPPQPPPIPPPAA
jgi:cell division protease FtsH